MAALASDARRWEVRQGTAGVFFDHTTWQPVIRPTLLDVSGSLLNEVINNKDIWKWELVK